MWVEKKGYMASSKYPFFKSTVKVQEQLLNTNHDKRPLAPTGSAELVGHAVFAII